MDLQNNNGVHVQNGTAKEPISKAAQNGAVKEITANQKKDNGKEETEKPKAAPVKEERPETAVAQRTTDTPQSAAQAASTVPVLNLESKLKVVESLHRKSIQRVNLISRMNQLEAFEVALLKENDELEDNPFQGCKLIIRDDKNREFVTTTPGLIRLTTQYIFSACHHKLAEIENSIVFPSA